MDDSIKLIEYLENTLSSNERAVLEERLKTDPLLKEELHKLEQLYDHFDEKIEVPEVLREDFKNLLKNEKQKKERNQQWIIWTGRAAAAIALIVVGVMAGRFSIEQTSDDNELATLRKEIQTSRQLILESLNETSASQRFIGVRASNKIEKMDPGVIEALIEVMNNDDNTNVRIAAVRALARFSENDEIKKSLINAMIHQNNPLVQVVLIEVLVETGDKKVVPALKNLIDSEKTLEVVKDEALWGTMKLS